MQHDDFDDPYGFWNDLPTRQFQRSHVGARAHGETRAMPRVQTRMVPVVRTQRNHVPPPQRPRNPLMTRILVMVGVGLLLAPVALGLRADKPRVRAADVKAVDPIFIGTMPAAPTDATVAPDTEAATTTLAATTAVPTTPAPTEAAPTTVAPTQPPVTTAQAKKKAAPRPATTPAPTIAPVAAATQTALCGASYTIASGDTWSGIASRAKVTMNSLLAANNATTSTLLLPGKSICLPEGAQQPGPPTTKAPTTTQPATTQPKSTTPTTTQPPPPTATTAPGTTQPAPPPNTYTKAQAAQIIRDVWPDELENSAIAIATRESNLIPTAHNYCCYGLFQIYYNAHKTWLASIGVTSAAQLYDPLVNATAAYALYRSSGWSPWGGDPLATTTTTVAP